MIVQPTECRFCGTEQRQLYVEVTTFGEAAPRYLPGQWEPCPSCGSTLQPVTAPIPCTYAVPCRAAGRDGMAWVWAGPPAPYPVVPTAEDILAALQQMPWPWPL